MRLSARPDSVVKIDVGRCIASESRKKIRRALGSPPTPAGTGIELKRLLHHLCDGPALGCRESMGEVACARGPDRKLGFCHAAPPSRKIVWMALDGKRDG